MPLFKYRALDADGNPVDGTMEGPFAHQVVVALQEQGLAVNAVRRLGHDTPPVETRKMNWQDLDQLNHYLLMATKSSLPLAPSIAAMAEDLDNPRVRPVLDDIRLQLEAGQPLESALARHPRAFNPVYRALIAAGERAGNLGRVFGVLSNYSKTMTELRSNVQLAMIYPLIIVLVSSLLIFGLLWVVVPQFKDTFQDFGYRLPWPTRLLMSLSDFLVARWLLILCAAAVVAAVPVAFYLNDRRDERHYRLDWLKLRVPAMRRLYKLMSVMQFTRTLSLLLEARVPLLESMELAGAAAGNAVLQRRVRHVARDLNAGASVAQALQKTRFYDGGTCWLIANAEKSGNLEETLATVADELERAVAYLHRSFTAVLAPTIVVVMGLLVGLVVIAMYLPIFSISMWG